MSFKEIIKEWGPFAVAIFAFARVGAWGDDVIKIKTDNDHYQLRRNNFILFNRVAFKSSTTNVDETYYTIRPNRVYINDKEDEPW